MPLCNSDFFAVICRHFSPMAPANASAAATAAYQPALIQSLGSAATEGGNRVPPKAAIITTEFGPLAICASSRDASAPDVSSLSILQLGGGLSADNSTCTDEEDDQTAANGEEDREIRLFGNDGNDTRTSAGSVLPPAARRLLDLMQSLPGIQERLMDAASAHTNRSAGTGGDTKTDVGHLEEFLSRSEAVVAELLAAIEQHRQRVARAAAASSSAGAATTTNKRKRSATTSTTRGDNTASSDDAATSLTVSYYAALFQQLSILEKQEGIDTIDITEDLSRVTISCHDAANRPHELTVDLPKTFPGCGGAGGGTANSRSSSTSGANRRPILYCDLPLGFDPKWKPGPTREMMFKTLYVSEDVASLSSSSHGLVNLYQQYRKALATYQALWDDLDEIDKSAWVLEPSLPANRSIAERRIALKPGLSLALTFDPERSRAPPLGARLVGSSVDAAALRERVAAIVDGASGMGDEAGWDETRSIKANLETCLGFVLPSPETTEKADYISECGICYAHRLPAEDGSDGDGAIPDAMCGNPSCARSYHETCLFEWLHSLPDARVSFDRVFGTCPYCSESLSVRVLNSRGK